jgi:hypothetical protein
LSDSGAAHELFAEILARLKDLAAAVRAPEPDPLDSIAFPDPIARSILEVMHAAGQAITKEAIVDACSWLRDTADDPTWYSDDAKTIRRHCKWLLDRGLIEPCGRRVTLSGLGRRYLASLPPRVAGSHLPAKARLRPDSRPSPAVRWAGG